VELVLVDDSVLRSSVVAEPAAPEPSNRRSSAEREPVVSPAAPDAVASVGLLPSVPPADPVAPVVPVVALEVLLSVRLDGAGALSVVRFVRDSSVLRVVDDEYEVEVPVSRPSVVSRSEQAPRATVASDAATATPSARAWMRFIVTPVS
jgi:hypothetical protein